MFPLWKIYCLRKRHTFWLSYLPCWTLPLHCMTWNMYKPPTSFRQQRMQGTSPCIRAREGISTWRNPYPLHQPHCIAEGSKALFTRQQEKEHTCPYTPTLKTYLYEPNASILKAGAFRSVSSIYNVEKLHPNSHLYTSDEYIQDFPDASSALPIAAVSTRKNLKSW